MSTPAEALQKAIFDAAFKKRVQALRKIYRAALGFNKGPGVEDINEAQAEVWVGKARFEIDAAIAALGLELGSTFAIAREAYGLPVELVIESVGVNVFAQAGIAVAGVKVRQPEPEQGEETH